MSNYTLTDKKMIDELERSREQLLSESSSHALVRVLRRKLQSITRNIYVFRWIPEQGEDLYDVLVDGVTVVHVEIPRDDPDQEALFENWPVKEYRQTRQSLTKPERRKLELALQLARSLDPHQQVASSEHGQWGEPVGSVVATLLLVWQLGC